MAPVETPNQGATHGTNRLTPMAATSISAAQNAHVGLPAGGSTIAIPPISEETEHCITPASQREEQLKGSMEGNVGHGKVRHRKGRWVVSKDQVRLARRGQRPVGPRAWRSTDRMVR